MSARIDILHMQHGHQQMTDARLWRLHRAIEDRPAATGLVPIAGIRHVMTSQVIEAATPEDVEDLLGESKRRNVCLSLYSRCTVAYGGRVQSSLNRAAGSSCASPTGPFSCTATPNRSPATGSPLEATVQVTDTDPLIITAVRTTSREVIHITCERVYHAALLPMDDDASLELQGSESDLRERIFGRPELIEEGFRPDAREYETPAGPVDVWGYDSDRRVGPDAVSQLRRYVKGVDVDVRGILVAPSITKVISEVATDQ